MPQSITAPLPAYDTKHYTTLHYLLPHHNTPLVLKQSDTTNSTGSTLWLSSQVLSEYLVHSYSQKRRDRRKLCALEFGSGIGLTALVLASLGFEVVATDVSVICAEFLKPNVDANIQVVGGPIIVQALEWGDSSALVELKNIDVVVASDLVYEITLIPDLCATIAKHADEKTIIYVAQEVRVQSLFDTFLEECMKCGLFGKEVPRKDVTKVMRARGWEEDAWEGVVVWKFKKRVDRKG